MERKMINLILSWISTLNVFQEIKRLNRVILPILMLFGITQNLLAEEHKAGLIPLTLEQVNYVEQNWPRIVGVKPNKLGALRIQEHLKTQELVSTNIPVATSQEELITVKGSEAALMSDELLLNVNSSILPSSVNNSTLPSFPPIGNQGPLESCVGWASTYYQGSHEIGLLNGINNKNSFANVLSPKWTYNNLNGGQDGGLVILDAYNLLSQNGATSIVNFPYDNNYLAWDLKPQDWVSALSNRLNFNLVSGAGSNPQNLAMIKQLLTNGHVLTFGTYIYSWVFTTVGNDPSNPNSPFVGQTAAYWMNGYNGGHHATIVGYNDDIWIDVNGNGQVDAGEKGAFLVANSWGPNWGNQGFVWVAYDAFLPVSAVANGPSAGRVPIGDALSSYLVSIVPKAANYSPSLVAQFALNQTFRNQLSVALGLSNTTASVPSQTFTSKALNYQGGAFEFDGTTGTTPTTATFALDFTDLLPPPSSQTSQRYYLLLKDDISSNPTTVTSYTLLDQVHKTQTNCPLVPLSCDNSSASPYIDYNFNGTIPVAPPVVAITSPTNGANLQGTVQVTVNATSNIGISHVDLYIDSVFYATDTSAPYLFSIDTSKLKPGSHLLSVHAYDTSNATSAASLTVQVSSSSIYVNAGGSATTYNGVAWTADQGYTMPSSVYTTTAPFANSVYQSERYGTFSYNFAVANGPHTVTLKFAEIYFSAPNQRVFNVLINGTQVISKLDLYKVAGFNVPYDQTFPINVTNNNIKIDFVPLINNAKVSAISITTP